MTEPNPTFIPQGEPIRAGDTVVVEPKNPFSSTVVHGLIVAIVARLLRLWVEKFFPGIVTDDAWVPIATELVGWVVGGFMILWGRWYASRKLGFGAQETVTVK